MYRHCTLLLCFLLLLLPIQCQYQSFITISAKGYEFLPVNHIAFLDQFNCLSFHSCAKACNFNFRCRTFDYDTMSQQCRLFEDESFTDQIILSNSQFSRVGSILYAPALYPQGVFNYPCDNACMLNRYFLCDPTLNTCQCPINTFWDGQVCQNMRYLHAQCSMDTQCRQGPSNTSVICEQATMCGQGGNNQSGLLEIACWRSCFLS